MTAASIGALSTSCKIRHTVRRDGVDVQEDDTKHEGMPQVVAREDVASINWDVKVSACQASGRQVLV
ncbi:hypothetical protein VNO77_39014 [Canavalia gladiata]|uniref:Uncharacterized protein n=1 Tax=Canavalia gladiata TaxID=3824 RepID=A0AAN9KAA6_CANGL